MISMFSNSNDLDKLTNISNNNMSPALSQGIHFKKYKHKFNTTIVECFEGSSNEVVSEDNPTFINESNENILTRQSNKIIEDNQRTKYDNDKLDALRKDYDASLKQYQDLMDKINKTSEDYIKRTTNNPYAGKTIRFTGGDICYVTQEGVVKYIESMEIWNSVAGKNGCLVTKTYTDVPVKYPDTDIQGTSIPELNLILGPHMQLGESCGNAGKNVFVNTLLNNTKDKYVGCYKDNRKSPLMTFIGSSPPPDVLIQNGNFSNSKIENNSYKYLSWNTTLIPGWNFNCVISNNSSAWGFPMPYPNGQQCAIIQGTQELWTFDYIDFVEGTEYIISFIACGRNCCDKSGKSNTINVGLEGQTFFTVDPPVNKWKTYYKTFTISGSKRISFKGTITNDRSTAIQNVQLSTSKPADGTYTYESCKQSAINNDYQYFSLQGVNNATSSGFCAVSNSEPTSSSLGESIITDTQISLWVTKTNNFGNTAFLNGQGSLVVNNSGGTAVWASPSQKATDYIGCYGDANERAMSLINSGRQSYNYKTCQDEATKGNFKYFGLQNSSSGQNAQCGLSNDKLKTVRYGVRNNCTKLTDGTTSGGGWSNAIYSREPENPYFLILQDDGNMCIYRGSGPSNNQGLIWETMTNGKQKSPNPNYYASKGKFGKNWISNGTSLAAGDFIGSTNGSIYLFMQSDGNLVLYTSTTKTNCSRMSDGNMGSGIEGNALYDIGSTAFKKNMGKLGFVDENDVLHNYPSDNSELTKNYTKISNLNVYENDIPNASYGNSTKEQCQTTCDSSKNCYGYVYDFQNKVCYPKTNEMWPYGGKSGYLNFVDTYIRGKKPISVPSGTTTDTINIDSQQYQFYNKGGPPDTKYGLTNANANEKTELERLEVQMKNQSNEISKLINKNSKGTYTSENQTDKNLQGLNEYEIKSRKITNDINILNSTGDNKRESFSNLGYNANNNINKILQDSDINVLQKNYDYLLWTILATGSVLVAMNITKN
jgi:hypothetical protein